MGFIPLMPYGWIDYSLPETGRDGPLYVHDAGQFKPREDLARAAAEELGATGMFTEVVMAPSASENDLFLRGEVTSTRYYVTLLTYGLSAAVGAAWLIGLPAGRITNELIVAFSLEETRTRTVLWHKSYAEKYTATYWFLYYMPPEFNYSALYKTILRDVVENIRMELERHP